MGYLTIFLKECSLYILMLLNKLFMFEMTQTLSAAVPELRSRPGIDLLESKIEFLWFMN